MVRHKILIYVMQNTSTFPNEYKTEFADGIEVMHGLRVIHFYCVYNGNISSVKCFHVIMSDPF